jgi:chromosome segregation ATPase
MQPAPKAPEPAVARAAEPKPAPPPAAPVLPKPAVPEAEPAEGERWEKIVDDTRSKINSTKAELDELSEELTPSKAERDAAISRLRVLEKDGNRKRARLEWFQRGRISEAKADEIANLERELGKIDTETTDWSTRLGSAQRHIDARIGACRAKRVEFDRIRNEVEALVASLPSEDRGAVYSAMEGELQDLQTIVREADKWVTELSIETSTVPLVAQRAMQDQAQAAGTAGLAPAAADAREASTPASAAGASAGAAKAE